MTKRFRSILLAVMTAILGGALVATATPAAAMQKQKKEAAAKGGQLAPSREFGPALKKMTDAAAAKDAEALRAALAEGDSSGTKADDRYLTAFYRLQLGILDKDQTVQAQALDAMLESGLTPPDSVATYNFFSGNFAYGAKDYSKAIQRLEAAKAAGSSEAALPILLMDSYLNAGQLDQGWSIAKAAIEANRAAGQRPAEELYVRPAQAFQNANRSSDTLDVLIMRVADYSTPATWRNTLYIMLQQSGDDKALSLDILRLMRATNAMTDRPEYAEYAAIATEAGYPGEVVSVIEHGQSKGVIPAGDAHFGGILESQEPRARDDAAALAVDATKPATLSNPRVALGTADALAGSGDYTKAIPLYEAAAAAGNPEAQYRLGVAQVLAGQKEAGVATLAKVQGNRQRLAQLWTIHAQPSAVAAAATTAS